MFLRRYLNILREDSTVYSNFRQKNATLRLSTTAEDKQKDSKTY